MWHKPKPETLQRHAEERQRERDANRASLLARLQAAYDAEPDREYAEAVWGQLLTQARTGKPLGES